MTQIASFIIAGLPQSGITTLIETLSPHSSKAEFGDMVINEALTIHLHGIGDDVWQDAVDAALGAIIMVDSTQPDTFQESLHLMDELWGARKKLPLLIAMNKQDEPDAHAPAEFQKLLPDKLEIKVFPCVATQRQSAENVLLALIYSVLA